MAAALFDETEHHAQAQPRPLTISLGGKKRFERLGEHLGRHADTRVLHFHTHVITGQNALARAKFVIEADIFSTEGNHALTFHGVPGIDRQVARRAD